MTATVSPGSSPPAISPLASALTSCRNFPAGTSTQPFGPFAPVQSMRGIGGVPFQQQVRDVAGGVKLDQQFSACFSHSRSPFRSQAAAAASIGV